MIYLITYNLNNVYNRDYNVMHLYEQIKSFGNWFHLLESVWFIKSDYDVNSINKKLWDAMGNNGQILVVNITKQAKQGFLPETAWEWLKNQEEQ